MTKPTIVLITGLPCSGKSKIAETAAAALDLPLFTKDHIKEALFETVGWNDRSWSRKLSQASFAILIDTIRTLLHSGLSCVVDGNFSPSNHSPAFQRLSRQYPCVIAQIQCFACAEVLTSRFEKRIATSARHPGHLDELLLDELRPALRMEKSGFLDLDGPKIEYDTSNGDIINPETVRQLIHKY